MTEHNKIICGDSLEVLRNMEDNSVDLTVTSPPYDNLRTYKGFDWDFEGIAKELYRVTKGGGVVVWVVGDATVNGSETGSSFKQALYFKEIGFRLHDTMIYEKNSAAFPDKNRYYNVFEYMFVFSKGRPSAVNRIEDKKNKWGGTQTFGKVSGRRADGTLSEGKKKTVKEYGVRNNVWRYNTGRGQSTTDDIAFKHPAIFPEKLAEDHIITWSNPGDTVLDPFAGSGTTAKMALLNGRKYISIDISEEYCEIARKRVEEARDSLAEKQT